MRSPAHETSALLIRSPHPVMLVRLQTFIWVKARKQDPDQIHSAMLDGEIKCNSIYHSSSLRYRHPESPSGGSKLFAGATPYANRLIINAKLPLIYK